MSLMKGDAETKRVVIEPPADVIERARRRAGGDETIESHLLDQYLFEYEWVGVEELRNE